MPADVPRTYPNTIPEAYDAEVADAQRARIHPADCPGDGFWQLAAMGDRLVYVITTARMLVVAQQVAGGFEIRHPVLAGGREVLAAGELEVAVLDEHRLVIELSNKSGHYRPDPTCLDIAVEVLEAHDFEILDGALRPYAGG